MDDKPISNITGTPPTVRPIVPGELLEKSTVSESPKKPMVRSGAHDVSFFPPEVFELIFEHFIPPGSIFRHRYDDTPFSVTYQPTFITFASLSETCKAFYGVVTYFRSKIKLIEFRKQGSRLEFDNRLKIKNNAGRPSIRSGVQAMDVSSTTTASTSSSTTSAGLTASSSAMTSTTEVSPSVVDIRKNCRLRYGIDPVVPGLAHTPQRARVHIVLGPGDLASSELKGHLQKEWRPEKRHMIFVDKLDSDDDCAQLASVLLEKVNYKKKVADVEKSDGMEGSDDMEELDTSLTTPNAEPGTINWLSRERAADVEELDINLIAPKLKQLPLAEAIANCTSLKHLAISNPNGDMLKALASLANLQSLKLRSCPIDGGTFETLANGEFKNTLQCLSVGIREFQLRELRALRDMAGDFTNLRDLRLYPGLEGINSVGGAEVAKALLALKSLDSLSISRIDFSVVSQIVPALQKLEAFRLLEFDLMTLNKDECAKLLQQLAGLPLLESLALSSPLNWAAASQLKIMLGKNACCLEYLRLRNWDPKVKAATELATGLNANRSLKSLMIGGADLDQASATILGEAVGNHPGLLDVQFWFKHTTATTTYRLLNGALASKSLMVLNLVSNGWSPEAEQGVLDLLKANTSLVRLVLPDLHANKSARAAHAQVLADNCRRGRVWTRPSSS